MATVGGTDRHVIRMVREHDDTGWDWHRLEPTGEVVYRDAIARVNNGDTREWWRFRCIQAACPGEALLRQVWVTDQVNLMMEER